ncbi:MAG: cytochrome d ubiquinol oxidase subunit II [Bacteroidales bacterium]|jgi:cytochrome d ubiquinol oxidase subunit II|nr:cytochrome d ubiquinol oxidase subunit II [Bacteroidales bacterium]
MFESLSHLALQQYWWLIISVLASLLVFLLFVQGGQTMLYTLARNEKERTMIINSLGRKWEFTFTTLVTFGGAFFASFPLFYSTSFGGAYYVWMLILFCFVIQAVSFEFRTKPANFLGTRTYETFLFINGLLGTVLLGIAVGTFFTGSEFSIDKMNLTKVYSSAISRWETPYYGLEAVLDLRNVMLGLAVFFLARVNGILYLMNSIDDENIRSRGKKYLLYNMVPFLIAFLTFVISIFLSNGFAYDANTKIVFLEPYKYFRNMVEMPLVGIMFLIGVVLVLYGIGRTLLQTFYKGIWFSGLGTVLTIISLFLITGYNKTAFYPSTFNLQHSLTIENASSSHYTLTVMSYVSLAVPFVILYIYYAWRAIDKTKITAAEMEENENHLY